MLVEFSVENFLSFKDMVRLNLEASSDKELPQNIIESDQDTDMRLLKSAVIYGANASGKSNLLAAMGLMRHVILASASERHPNPLAEIKPFKLHDKSISQPSTFEVVFVQENVRYLYGFSATPKNVVEEWFYSYPFKRRRVLFERNANSSNSNKGFKFGDYWKGEGMRLADMTRPNALFISTAAQFNHPLAGIVVDWFSNKFKSVLPLPTGQSEDAFTMEMCLRDPENKNKVLDLLKNADLAIFDFFVKPMPIDEAESLRELPLEVRDKILEDLKGEPREKKVPELTIVHQGYRSDGGPMHMTFDPHEESDGTRKYFALAGPLIHVMSEGICLFVDELDVRLHTLLTRGVIELFHDEKFNSKGAQLICAVHDVDLLSDKHLFRRDQIWFTAKNELQATELYSAWDYRARKNESLLRGYLAGRYGAIPFIEKLLY